MANGVMVPSHGVWHGVVDFGGMHHDGQFEVFLSGGAWEMLFGKPLLEAFEMVHDYKTDELVVLKLGGGNLRVANQYGCLIRANALFIKGVNLASVMKSHAHTSTPLENAPPRKNPQVKIEEVEDKDSPNIPSINAIPKETCNKEFPPWGVFPILLLSKINAHVDSSIFAADLTTGEEAVLVWPVPDDPGPEQPEVELGDNTSLFTRQTEPFKLACAKKIVKLVEVGPDLSAGQRTEVKALVAKFMDIFAQSVSELTAVNNAVHTLHIPEGKTFSRKIHQQPLKVLERDYFFLRLDEMEKCRVIHRIDPADVKCCSPTTLAQKAHENQGLTLLEIHHRVNNACNTAGIPWEFDLPEHEPPSVKASKPLKATKYHICQNYTELNRVTQIAPMPQEDI